MGGRVADVSKYKASVDPSATRRDDERSRATLALDVMMPRVLLVSRSAGTGIDETERSRIEILH